MHENLALRAGTAYNHNYSLDYLAAYICVQLRGIFTFTLEPDDGRTRLVFLGRWAVRSLVGDATGAQILHWAVPSTGSEVPGCPGAYYQFVSKSSVFEVCAFACVTLYSNLHMYCV